MASCPRTPGVPSARISCHSIMCYVVVLRNAVEGKLPSRKLRLKVIYIVDDDLMACPFHPGNAVDDLRFQD